MPVIKLSVPPVEAEVVDSVVIKANSTGDLTNYFPFNYLAGLAGLPFPSALGIKETQNFMC